MQGHEAPLPLIETEVLRLQELGFERLGSSNLAYGGDMLVEPLPDGTPRLYTRLGPSPEKLQSVTVSAGHKGMNLNFMSAVDPERAAQIGRTVEFHVTPVRNGGPNYTLYADEEKRRLEALSSKSITDQLLEGGFTIEQEEGDTRILHLQTAGDDDTPPDEVVCIIKADQLMGVFVPLEQRDPDFALDVQRVIGIHHIPSDYSGDPPKPGVRVTNGWAEFTITRSPFPPRKPHINRQPTNEELGLEHPEQIVEPSGFVQYGSNSTEVIRRASSLNGVPVTQLTKDMQPGEMSIAGFMGRGEDVITVIAEANDLLQSKGVTNTEIAETLLYFNRLHELGLLERFATNEVPIKGHTLLVRVDQSGSQNSPFQDGLYGSKEMTVTDPETGKSFKASELAAKLLDRYCFPEGKGTPYRLQLEQIIDTIPHLREKARSTMGASSADAGAAARRILGVTAVG